MSEKKKGSYYWVFVSVEGAQPEWQPARFTGFSGDGDGVATWDFVGLRSEDGHHFAEVIDVLREVTI